MATAMIASFRASAYLRPSCLGVMEKYGWARAGRFNLPATMRTVKIRTSSFPTVPESVLQYKNPPRTLLLLATRKYASSILSDEFSQHLLEYLALYGKTSKFYNPNKLKYSKVDVLAAVIEELPPPDDKNRFLRNEGWSWCISQHNLLGNGSITASDGVLESQPTEKEFSSRAKDEPVRVSFTFRDNEEGKEKAIILPLANTIFQTGMTSTLRRMTFLPMSQSSSIASYYIQQDKIFSSTLSPITVTFPSLDRRRYSFTSDLWLAPLTPPRQVLACAGNIISRLSSDSKESGPIPASRELEKAMELLHKNPARTSDFLDCKRKLEIFAYICSEPYCPTGDPAGGESAKGPVFYKILLNDSKGTIRRIISGGGGWGNKAGLLSLDYGYDPAYSGFQNGNEMSNKGFRDAFEEDFFSRYHTDRKTEAENNEQGINGHQIKQGGNSTINPTSRGTRKDRIVNVGDWIEFFLAPNLAINGSETSEKQTSKIFRFRFGCAGREDGDSSIEGGEEKGTNIGKSAANGADSANTFEVENIFGGATEVGVWFKRLVEMKEGNTEMESEDELVKMDVPGAWVEVNSSKTNK